MAPSTGNLNMRAALRGVLKIPADTAVTPIGGCHLVSPSVSELGFC